MKQWLGRMCLFLAGAGFAVGCGGTAQDGAETADSSNSVSPPSATAPGESPAANPEGPFPDGEPSGTTGELAICCHVKCAGVDWAGPYPSIVYNNCPAFAKYSCKQRGLAYETNAWRKC
ncbi:hypothetical protein MEBOL_007369 [Melittangium boletus DSM 14713]|uniref:Lipoprotein n=1 Tax=Melittangium boletus DSM 14713 TaxID=1294270 RepID=A0A250IRG0_9BACT|nr:hypothetical protein MEBOL_007369 [Melittangium boletus DSM 14713]